MADKLIIQEKEGGVAILSLNRPAMMNALSLSMMDEFGRAIDELKFDNTISALIITAAEGKGFCAGADLKERATMNELEVRQCLSKIRATINGVAELPMPTIAAVNGFAFGGGTEIALACDIRILSEKASMGLTETSLAIIPGGGGTQRLPRIIGAAKAKELIFTAKRVGAEEALSIGLANKVVPHDELLAAAKDMATQIAQNGPIALRAAKKAVDKGIEVDLASGLAFEIACYESTIPTEDRIEGLTAFKEKRKPVYKGK
jgi:methylglutaconyl-CoA hydratase